MSVEYKARDKLTSWESLSADLQSLVGILAGVQACSREKTSLITTTITTTAVITTTTIIIAIFCAVVYFHKRMHL